MLVLFKDPYFESPGADSLTSIPFRRQPRRLTRGRKMRYFSAIEVFQV